MPLWVVYTFTLLQVMCPRLWFSTGSESAQGPIHPTHWTVIGIQVSAPGMWVLGHPQSDCKLPGVKDSDKHPKAPEWGSISQQGPVCPEDQPVTETGVTETRPLVYLRSPELLCLVY